MKILITGANGVAASSFIEQTFAKLNVLFLTDRKTSSNDIIEGDLSNYDFVKYLIETTKPEIVIHLAANTNVDFCEQNKLNATLDNFVSTKNLVDVLMLTQVPIIYTSTASIFQGNLKYGYLEDSPTYPLNYYALTKLLSESILKRICKNILF